MKLSVAKVIFVRIFVVAVLAAAAGLISCSGENDELMKIEIFPDNPSIATKYTRQLLGTGTLSNGISYTMTILTWSSSDPGVADVSAFGLVTAVSTHSHNHRYGDRFKPEFFRHDHGHCRRYRVYRDNSG